MRGGLIGQVDPNAKHFKFSRIRAVANNRAFDNHKVRGVKVLDMRGDECSVSFSVAAAHDGVAFPKNLQSQVLDAQGAPVFINGIFVRKSENGEQSDGSMRRIDSIVRQRRHKALHTNCRAA